MQGIRDEQTCTILLVSNFLVTLHLRKAVTFLVTNQLISKTAKAIRDEPTLFHSRFMLQIVNKINHFAVGFVNTSIIIINVNICDGARSVTECS